MTVSELMEELSNLPPNTRVFTTGYEDGYDDPNVSSIRKFLLDVNTSWYYGPHEEAASFDNGKEFVLGVVIA